jgi:hypothetical protein
MIKTVNVTKTINVHSEKTWKAISGIGGLERWFPVIKSCDVQGEGVGAIRTLELVQGGKMRDRIDEIDHENRRLRYLRFEHPFPINSYQGTVEVRNVPDGRSTVCWSVELDVALDDVSDYRAYPGAAEPISVARDEEEDARAVMLDFLKKMISDAIAAIEQDLQNVRQGESYPNKVGGLS